MKISLSATLEAALSDLESTRQCELWKKENKAAIDAYNQLIEQQGTFSESLPSSAQSLK